MPNSSENMITCKKCEKVLPAAKFYKSNHHKNGFNTCCKKCVGEKISKWKSANKDKVARYSRISRRRDGGRSILKQILKKRGISQDQYAAILAAQGNVCAICGRQSEQRDKESNRFRRLYVDHDHETNLVRGLLCWKCNSGLGFFEDNRGILLSAIVYLESAKYMNAVSKAGIDPIEAWTGVSK